MYILQSIVLMLVIPLGLLFPNNLALIVIYIMAIHCRIPRMKRQNRTLLFHLRTLPNISNIPCLQIFQNKKRGRDIRIWSEWGCHHAHNVGIRYRHSCMQLVGKRCFLLPLLLSLLHTLLLVASLAAAAIIISKWLPFSPISVNPKKMEKNSSLLALPLSLFLCRCFRIGCHLLNTWCILPVINWPGSTTNTSQCLNSDKIDTNECNSSSR